MRSDVDGMSSLSHESALAIVESLSQQYSNVIITVINTVSDLTALIDRKPDLVFMGMMRIMDSMDPTEEVWLSEQLELAGIAHTGSTRISHELEHLKDQAKQQVLDHGLATALFHVVSIDELNVQQPIGLEFPLFVKPINGGGGLGVDQYSIVRTAQQLQDKISSLRAANITNILIEHYLEGREFSVAIIKDLTTDKHIAMPLELIAPKDINGARMLGSEVKSANQEQAIGLDDLNERNLISTFALDVFQALGARDYGRIDIRFDGAGVPHFLEANLIPSLISGYGSFPKAYKLNLGVDYDEMIHNIVMLGLSRAPVLA